MAVGPPAPLPGTPLTDSRSVTASAPPGPSPDLDLEFDFDETLFDLHPGSPSQDSIVQLIDDLPDELGQPADDDVASICYSAFNADDIKRFNAIIRGDLGIWSANDPPDSNDDQVSDNSDDPNKDDQGDGNQDPPIDDCSPSIQRPALASARAQREHDYSYSKGAVLWTRFFDVFSVPTRFRRPFAEGIRLFPRAPFARHPLIALGPVDHEIASRIVSALATAGIITPTSRSPYVAAVFLVPKSPTESRLIVDFSKLTPYLPCPKFYLPSVFQLLDFLNFEDCYLCKLDLKDAFFHIGIHPDSQYVTTFRFNGKYFRFTCLPFGLSVSPYHMQMLANCISDRFRQLGLLAWGHIDDFVVAHLDYDFVKQAFRQVLQELIECGVLINWRKTIAEPTRDLTVLGAVFNTVKNTATLSRERRDLIERLFQILHGSDRLRLVSWQRILGHFAYVWPFIKSPWFLLKPLYEAEDSGLVPHDAVRRAHEAWIANLKAISLILIFPEPEVIYVDATPSQIGFVHNTVYYAIVLKNVLPIYVSELLAIIFAMFYAINCDFRHVHVFSDNQGAIGTTRRLRGYLLPDGIMSLVFYLKARFTRFTISYIDTLANPADYPSRIDLQS